MQANTTHPSTPCKRDLMLTAGIKEFSLNSYNDTNTDRIVTSCNISKGLLFHYFGSKKGFYIACLDSALNRLIQPTVANGDTFYEILFAHMQAKIAMCTQFPLETAFVNMASRESAAAIAEDKKELFKRYAIQTNAESTEIIGAALSKLTLRDSAKNNAVRGLMLYSSAVINQYLIRYQTNPKAFFEQADIIQAELKDDIDMFLYGIVQPEM